MSYQEFVRFVHKETKLHGPALMKEASQIWEIVKQMKAEQATNPVAVRGGKRKSPIAGGKRKSPIAGGKRKSPIAAGMTRGQKRRSDRMKRRQKRMMNRDDY